MIEATLNIDQQDPGVIAKDTIKTIIINSPKIDNIGKEELLKDISPDIK